MLTLLVSLQDFAGALDHAARKAGEPGNFDSVTLVRAARLDAAQENNLARSLFHRHVNVFHRGEKIAKLRQLMIMRGEKSPRASVFLQMFDDLPPMLGPVIKSNCCRPGSKQRSLGTKRSPFWRSNSSITGWRPPIMSSSPVELNSGRE